MPHKIFHHEAIILLKHVDQKQKHRSPNTPTHHHITTLPISLSRPQSYLLISFPAMVRQPRCALAVSLPGINNFKWNSPLWSGSRKQLKYSWMQEISWRQTLTGESKTVGSMCVQIVGRYIQRTRKDRGLYNRPKYCKYDESRPARTLQWLQ